MADDFVLTVRQIAQYPVVTSTGPLDAWILQQGGIGGPYKSISPPNAVGTALELGGYLHLAPTAGGISWNGVALTSDGLTISATADVHVPSLHSVGDIFVAGQALATQANVTGLIDAVFADTVHSFNGRQGTVQLDEQDILRAGGILQNNPHFTGTVLVPTVWDFRSNDQHAASTAWVQGVLEQLLCSGSVVTSFNGRGGDIILTADDISLAATFPGATPRANNPPLGDASNRIATTMFVDDTVFDMEDRLTLLINQQTDFALALYAPLASPAFTGVPTAPTAAPGNTTGQLATTAFVMNAVAAATAGVSSFNTRTGAVTLVTADITAAGGAPINAPNFTGVPQAVTAAPGTNTQQLATTAFVHAALLATNFVASFNGRTGVVTLTTADITGAGGAPSASPALSGTPTAPTAAPATNTTQIATTAFVQAALGTVTGAVSSWNGRTGAVTLQSNDISAAGGALLASPSFTGTPLAPTAAPGTNTTQLATTAFVMANAGVGGVSSFNGRQGAITLLTADVTGAGGAPIASPAFTGTPTAPTAAQTVNDQTIATTAYVRSAIAAATGVASFNTRTGAVTLTSADVSSAGGALTTGPTFTGVPSAPTASPGTNTTQLATCAFVQAAVGAAVTSFNGRTGAITLIANDITAAGGALLASPTFTGTPNAPTPATGTNNTQIATTAFVQAQIAAAGGVTYKQSDTSPSPVTTFWFDSLNGQLYVRYVDPVSSAQNWVIANSYTPPAPTPAKGTRVLLATTTVVSGSPVASVNFTGVFTNAYDIFEVDFIDVQGDTSGDYLAMRLSTNNGVSFDSASNYNYAITNVYENGTGAASAGGNTTSMAMTSALWTGPTVPTISTSGRLKLYRPWNGANRRVTAMWDAQFPSNALSGIGGRVVGSASYVVTTAAVNAIQFIMYNHNIAIGIFNLYGIAK